MNSIYPLKTYKALEGVVEGAQPFFIASRENNDKVVIIIHGFTSSPNRLHWVAEKLAENGYDVDCVVLAGHGGSLEYLRKSTADQWRESAEMAVKANLQKYKKVYLVGYSFGANLAIHLGVRYPQIKGLVSLGIPITLYKEKSIRTLLPLARLVMKDYKKRWIEKDEVPKLFERGHHIYIPIKSLLEFRNFISHCTKSDIPKLQVPILIGHSRQDKVADAISSQYLFEHLTVADKSLYLLNQGNHRVEDGISRDFVAKKMLDFLAQH